MSEQHIILPSKPRAVLEEDNKGVFEIDGLVPGYGYTLGNSLRRIILSSLPGAAVTSVNIKDVSHEFSTIEGVKEDVITILLNLKNVRFAVSSDEPQNVTLSIKGPGIVTAKDIKTNGSVDVINEDQYICEITGKASLSMDIKIERGLGYVAREQHHKEKADIGTIFLDAIFSPIRRVSYEVEEMRVGDKTNFNRLRLSIETDGTISARDALTKSIQTMVDQLAAIIEIDSKEAIENIQERMSQNNNEITQNETTENDEEIDVTDVLKTRIDSIGLSTRTLNALSAANIRTIGGIARKHVNDLLEIEGIGEKGINEIKDALVKFDLSLRD